MQWMKEPSICGMNMRNIRKQKCERRERYKQRALFVRTSSPSTIVINVEIETHTETSVQERWEGCDEKDVQTATTSSVPMSLERSKFSVPLWTLPGVNCIGPFVCTRELDERMVDYLLVASLLSMVAAIDNKVHSN